MSAISHMLRKPRTEYEGAVYYEISCGNRQADIYNDDTDREPFLETLTGRIRSAF